MGEMLNENLPHFNPPLHQPLLARKERQNRFFQHYYTVINVVVIAVFYRLLRQNVAHNCDCCDDDYFILKTIGEKNAQKEEEKIREKTPSHLVRKRLMITIIFFSGTSAENSLNVVLSY